MGQETAAHHCLGRALELQDGQLVKNGVHGGPWVNVSRCRTGLKDIAPLLLKLAARIMTRMQGFSRLSLSLPVAETCASAFSCF